jgi:hypothetical protein
LGNNQNLKQIVRKKNNKPTTKTGSKIMEKSIEQQIQDKGLIAPRITPEDITNTIASAFFFTAAEGAKEAEPDDFNYFTYESTLSLLTFCVIVLKNGFTVTGESACASPENYNKEIGQKIAFNNAKEKIWMLEGYLLKEKLSS